MSFCVWMVPDFCCLHVCVCLRVKMRKAKRVTCCVMCTVMFQLWFCANFLWFVPPVPYSHFIWERSPPPAHGSAHSDCWVKLPLPLHSRHRFCLSVSVGVCLCVDIVDMYCDHFVWSLSQSCHIFLPPFSRTQMYTYIVPSVKRCPYQGRSDHVSSNRQSVCLPPNCCNIAN